MPKPKLNNYLRTFRRNHDFSQQEMAFLLGCKSGAKVSRYERSKRMPSLDVIFTYEVVFGTTARDLFAGIEERARRKALRRVRLLTRRLTKKSSDSRLSRKLQFLKRVVNGHADDLRYEPLPTP